MTFTADTYGEDFLESGELDLYEEDPEHPCNIRLECRSRIFWLAWFEGWNVRADYFGLLDMQVRISEETILIGLIAGGVKRRIVTAEQGWTLLNLSRAQTWRLRAVSASSEEKLILNGIKYLKRGLLAKHMRPIYFYKMYTQLWKQISNTFQSVLFSDMVAWKPGELLGRNIKT